MRRLPDDDDRLVPANAPPAGHYLNTSTHARTPVPEARAEAAAPAPRDLHVPVVEATAPPAAGQPGAAQGPPSRSASEVVLPGA
eukprot:4331294-Alexandrium_andersonii.AAC.1